MSFPIFVAIIALFKILSAIPGNVYDRLITGITQITKNIPTARDERLGSLTSSPENLGSSISVTARLNLVKLSEMPEKLCEIAENFNLQVIKSSDNNIYEAANKKKLGMTEFETVNRFAEGIKTLIDVEKSL